ncbi:MAG TPA: hypothetical protein PLD59_17115, partial [Tepidisphaeraceae bacterium]|nr:hypothetical protein [Tepidisphaeraceae bacterium]
MKEKSPATRPGPQANPQNRPDGGILPILSSQTGDSAARPFATPQNLSGMPMPKTPIRERALRKTRAPGATAAIG